MPSGALEEEQSACGSVPALAVSRSEVSVCDTLAETSVSLFSQLHPKIWTTVSDVLVQPASLKAMLFGQMWIAAEPRRVAYSKILLSKLQMVEGER